MNWSRENTLYFIHLIRERPGIWDVNSPEFKNKYKRNEVIEEVARLMNISVRDVNSKWTSLRGQFNREKRKFSGVQTGTGPDATPVVSKWFAYNQMDDLMRCSNSFNFFHDSENNEIYYGDYASTEYLEEEGSGSNKEWNTSQGGAGASTPTTEFASWQFKNERANSNERPSPNERQKPTDRSNDLLVPRDQANGLKTPNNQKDTEPTLAKRPRTNVWNTIYRRNNEQKLNLEYDTFGQYVAAQMKSLSEEDAVLAQAEIHEVMTKYRLKKVKGQENTSYQCNNTPGPSNNSPFESHAEEIVIKCEAESD